MFRDYLSNFGPAAVGILSALLVVAASYVISTIVLDRRNKRHAAARARLNEALEQKLDSERKRIKSYGRLLQEERSLSGPSPDVRRRLTEGGGEARNRGAYDDTTAMMAGYAMGANTTHSPSYLRQNHDDSRCSPSYDSGFTSSSYSSGSGSSGGDDSGGGGGGGGGGGWD